MNKEEANSKMKDSNLRWHHRLNGHLFKQIPRDSGGQESLVSWSSRGGKESDTTQRLNNNKGMGDTRGVAGPGDHSAVPCEPCWWFSPQPVP